MVEDMCELGASDGTRSMIESYLEGRKARLTIGNARAETKLTRGCPQGSQLAPVLWKLAMDNALRLERDERVKIVAYADDIAVLIAGSNIEVIRRRSYGILEALSRWAVRRGLTFSSGKTQVISLKGGLKPGFHIRFGDDLVVSASPVRYLGVLIDYKRNYWDHVNMVARKSEDIYSRLKGASSADRGLGQRTAEILYKAVFLPRITYASEIWYKALRTKKAIRVLGSAQRRALISITRSYRTASTDALQVTAAKLPLDLEVELGVLVLRLKAGHCSQSDLERERERILDVWQDRWDRSSKGRWTHSIFPNVRFRLADPLELDHYVTQFIIGHGEFNAKLYQFKLIGSGRCRCQGEQETVEHVLFRCPLVGDVRDRLSSVVCPEGEVWPCDVRKFVATRANFRAFSIFAKEAIRLKQDYTYSNSMRKNRLD